MLKALSTMVSGSSAALPPASACPPGATDLLCAIIVQVCEQTSAPAACTKKDPDPIAITTPLGGLPVPTGPTPITVGGGSGSSIDGGGELATGGVPEPSTWVMIFIGALRPNRLAET